MKNAKFSKRLVPNGTYNALINSFDFIENYEMGYNTYPVFSASFNILDNGNIKKIDSIIFYDEKDDSYCSEITDKFDSATGNVINDPEELAGKFVDLKIKTNTSEKGNNYIVIDDVSVFTGNVSDFLPTPPIQKTVSPSLNKMLDDDEDEDE